MAHFVNQMPSRHWTDSVKALKETQSTEKSVSEKSLTGLILSSSGSGLLWEGAVLPLHQFSYASDHIAVLDKGDYLQNVLAV